MHDEDATALEILKEATRDILAAASLFAFMAGMVALMFATQGSSNLPV